MMKKMFLCYLFILLISSMALGEISFSQDFQNNPSLSAWTVLDTTSTGTATISADSTDGLKIDIENGAMGRMNGIKSNSEFSVPDGGYLVFDFYATNNDSASAPGINAHHSSPIWLVSPYDASADGYFNTTQNFLCIKGKDSYVGDYTRWYGWGVTGYEIAGDGTETWATFKHLIIKIDAAEINFYIEDDYYENIAEPNAVKTLNTADFLTPYDLSNGLYAYILNAKSTSWYSGATANLYDGVKITAMTPNEPADCASAVAQGYGIASDVNNDCQVDTADVAIMASQWIDCVGGSECSEPWLDFYGRSEYIATPAPATVTINGDLSEWPAFDHTTATWKTSQWVAIDRTYYGLPSDVENAYMCLMYDAADDVIYGAVIVDDYQGVYGYTGWNGQDDIEIYIQGDPQNDGSINPSGVWANAQQISVGLENDQTTVWTQWADGVPFGGHEGETGSPNIVTAVSRDDSAGHDHLVYEFKITPYDNYGGIDGTTTVVTDVQQGSVIGFDIVLSVKSSDPVNYGMLCPNVLTGKSGDVTKYATVTCQ